MEPSNTPLCIWKVPFFGTGSHWVVFSSCLAIWAITQHDKRRGHVEATSRQRRGNVSELRHPTSEASDLRRRLRWRRQLCAGTFGSARISHGYRHAVMLSWRFTAEFTAIHGVRHWTWIKNSQEVKHVEAYPATLPTAGGSAERVREDIAIRGKKWCEQTARSREREADKRSSSFSSMGRRCVRT